MLDSLRTGLRTALPAAGILLAVLATGAMPQPALAQGAAGQGGAAAPGKKAVFRPSILFAPHVRAAADSMRIWVRTNRDAPADRHQFYEAVRGLLEQNHRFARRLGQTYSPGAFEWIMITDSAADTLTTLVYPMLQEYLKAHPEELLTEGRQQIELALMRIVGAPPRLLGFHFVRLADYVYAAGDSLLSSGTTKDVAGVEDGVLRHMAEWADLYRQVHADPLSIFQSRTNQEDWIIVRLKDKCGNSGGDVWELQEQWMAVVDRDTTVTPAEDKYAHEYHLKSRKCPDDTRVIYIDLPNYNELQREIARQQTERSESRSAQTGKDD